MKNGTPLWSEAHLEVKSDKTPPVRSTFGSCDVEKMHAVVVRSIFASENVQDTSGPEHFWQSPCDVDKMHAVVARSTFGSEHVQNTTCSGHLYGHPDVVPMSKKCKPLWREGHLEVKSVNS